MTRPGGRVAVFCNNWQRNLLLPGHRAVEFALILASDAVLRPPVATGPAMDLEHIAGWLRAAGLESISVTTHSVGYASPLPPAARAYVDFVLDEDYRPALEVADLDPLAKADARSFLTRGQRAYLPDQPHYYCAKVGVLFTGTVGE